MWSLFINERTVVFEKMEVYWQFLMQHWALSGLFGLLFILFIVNELRGRAFGVPSVTPSELVNMMNRSRAAIIDTRDKAQFEQGHILGATNILVSELDEKKKSLQKYKSRPIVVVCETGSSASKAGQWLLDQGFSDIHVLQGGMMAWRSENFPVSK